MITKSQVYFLIYAMNKIIEVVTDRTGIQIRSELQNIAIQTVKHSLGFIISPCSLHAVLHFTASWQKILHLSSNYTKRLNRPICGAAFHHITAENFLLSFRPLQTPHAPNTLLVQ